MNWHWVRVIGGCVIVALLILGAALAYLARGPVPETVTYGMSFNALYARELGLDPDAVLGAIIDDLGVRHFRLAAHWKYAEPIRDVYDFTWLDSEISRVEQAGGTVILGVGRRLPRWPECHVPTWAETLTWEETKAELRAYITTVVERYKDSPAVTTWQVENEPFLTVFASEHCGDTLDEEFLREEVALVRSLDPSRPVLVTDSGNLGTWRGAYQIGDQFGTSVYVYFWNPELGQFRSILPPWFYRAKAGLMRALYGDKETHLIELSLEPWLVEPITGVPIDVQRSRMNQRKMDEILEYARYTGLKTQYLWGAEWWYWMRERGDPSYWEKGREIFRD